MPWKDWRSKNSNNINNNNNNNNNINNNNNNNNNININIIIINNNNKNNNSPQPNVMWEEPLKWLMLIDKQSTTDWKHRHAVEEIQSKFNQKMERSLEYLMFLILNISEIIFKVTRT